jgi:hypothetical protein
MEQLRNMLRLGNAADDLNSVRSMFGLGEAPQQQPGLLSEVGSSMSFTTVIIIV